MAQRRQAARGLLPGLAASIPACAPTAGLAPHPPATTKPSRASSTRRARRSTPAAPTSPSPTSPARSASPARRCTGTSPAPTRCSSRPPCTPRTTSTTAWKHTCRASPTRSKPSPRPSRRRSSGCRRTNTSACSSFPGRPNPHIESVTGDVALDFAHSMVRRFDVDWAGLGFSDDDLDELAEHLLRIIQSFVIDPGRPPRTRRGTARLPAAVGRLSSGRRSSLALRARIRRLEILDQTDPQAVLGVDGAPDVWHTLGRRLDDLCRGGHVHLPTVEVDQSAKVFAQGIRLYLKGSRGPRDRVETFRCSARAQLSRSHWRPWPRPGLRLP